MVETLLLIVLVLLLIVLSNLNSKHKELQNSIYRLHEKFNDFKKEIDTRTFGQQQVKETTQESIDKEKVVSSVVVEKPIEVVPKKTEPETIKPVAEKPIEIVAKIEAKPISEKAPTTKTPLVPKKSWYEAFKENNPDLEKFIGENLINKIGILILVLGISFFVKFAIDKDWINEPARVGIGVLAGSLVMFIANKLRKNYAAFSSVLVAGAISIFYFTISIAFHDYHLFSQTVAFIIMVVITAFSALVSVFYNRQELAVLSLIGGFAVPFMVSTGSGNYVVLFTYIAILNCGILGIAYFKKWNVVTVLSFVFTTLLFLSWYIRELFDNKLPHQGALAFATLFYFIFSVTLVVNNIRKKGTFSLIEYFILILNTFFFFGIGMGIIHNWGINFKGLFTVLLAVYNLVYAAILYKKFGLDKNAVYLLIGLALTFVTLTIPIQFEGNQITIFWAAEAVLLFWLSQKSKIAYFKTGAFAVQVLTIISLFLDWIKYDYYETNYAIILNALFMSGFVVSISFFLTYTILQKEVEEEKAKVALFSISFYKKLVFVVAIGVTYFTGFLEVNYQSSKFFLNPASALSFPVTYHFVFVTILLFLVDRFKKIFFQKVVLLISVFSIVTYIINFYSLPNNELVQNFALNTTSKYAFYFHYIILGCLVYFGVQLFKLAKSQSKATVLQHKIMPWLFVFATVYILSNEVLVHGLHFSATQQVDIKTINADITKRGITDAYEVQYQREYSVKGDLEKIKRQIIKIGYPILWGLFSFVFLIIGIKRQWKNLRVIALSLLGITILKLFIYDIKNVSETGKIIAFILLGVLILIISFVYQKIKKLVVDEQPKSNADEKVD
ncbi:DUF2339 domain-containing protein [Flavobacterium sp. NRK F7]|uniref:DUF2339 domain-containing protein n=1 Tax=Flavobacterium sp. NRK F7 TaxID=2954930 RepID=UPI002091C42E|nr:DUF2339 domain-containing protein [Flavobacterium sp. NRK F7]MCO6161250.1 DUF2339 domain-containing protein [Flavobacterium sp. NRK F7]